MPRRNFLTNCTTLSVRAISVLTFGVILNLVAERAMAITNSHAIEGYSDVLSVSPGETIRFSVHVPSSRSRFQQVARQRPYKVEILRFGAQDAGGNAVGKTVAGPFTCTNGRSRDFDEFNAYVDGAQWPVSFSLKVPSSLSTGVAPCTGAPLPASIWKSGIYTAKISDSYSGQYFHMTFIVKDSAQTQKSIALIASTNTWQAYNFWPGQAWGGASIYEGCGGLARDKVTFLRPNPYASPEAHDDTTNLCPNLDRPYYRTEHLVAGELRVAHWLEANGKSYSMLTDWDIATIPGVLNPTVFKTVIISTHSEYWSPAMYDAVTQYLAKGGNVISLSGNTVYWRVTLADDAGNRTLEKHENWTPQEQAQLLGLGSFDASGVGNIDCTPYGVLLPDHWAFQNIPSQYVIGSAGVIVGTTTCQDGSHGAAGWEVDRTDPSLHVFAREFAVLGVSFNQVQHAHLIYMRRASAGQVLSAGSITFGQSLMVDQPLSDVVLQVLRNFGSPSFGDFNRDGKPDLVARKPDGTLWLYNGDGTGGLAAGVQFASGWGVFDQLLAPGDFNGDGKADLIARDTSGKLWLYKVNRFGDLVPPSGPFNVGWQIYDLLIAPGDFDDDGRPDLLARKPDGTLWLYRGTGTGSLVAPSGPFNVGWQIYDLVIAPGDFDEDGNPDLLARKPDGTLWLYRGNGNGDFVSGGIQIDSQWDQFVELITPGDFDGDGHADVLARKPDGKLRLYNGLGDGTFLQNGGTQIGIGWDIFDTVVGVW